MTLAGGAKGSVTVGEAGGGISVLGASGVEGGGSAASAYAAFA